MSINEMRTITYTTASQAIDEPRTVVVLARFHTPGPSPASKRRGLALRTCSFIITCCMFGSRIWSVIVLRRAALMIAASLGRAGGCEQM